MTTIKNSICPIRNPQFNVDELAQSLSELELFSPIHCAQLDGVSDQSTQALRLRYIQVIITDTVNEAEQNSEGNL